jgi:hypothetical protein
VTDTAERESRFLSTLIDVLAIVIVLAVVAAFLYALSEYLQQRAAWRSAQTVDTDARTARPGCGRRPERRVVRCG